MAYSPYDPLAAFGIGGGTQSAMPTWGVQRPLPGVTTSMPTPGMLGGGAAGAAQPDFWSMQGFLGSNGQGGWGAPALGAVSGLLNGFMGMQNYGLAKQQLALQREAFETNTANQRKLVNSQLEDRQRARVASNPSAYQNVDEYLRRNGV